MYLSLLKCAATDGDITTVRQLLSIDAPQSDQWPEKALGFAATSGQLKLVEWLLNNKITTVKSCDALESACSSRRLDRVEACSARGLGSAEAYTARLNIAECLLKRLDLGIINYNTLISIAKCGYIDIIDRIFAQAKLQDINRSKWPTPETCYCAILQRASMTGQHQVAKTAVERLEALHVSRNRLVEGASVALASAAANGHTCIVEWLVSGYADPNFNGSNALIEAIRNGFPDIVGILLKYGARPPVTDDHFLKIIARNKNPEITDIIFSSPVISNINVYRLLEHASIENDINMVKYILKLPRFQPIDPKRITIVHTYCTNNRNNIREYIELLLSIPDIDLSIYGAEVCNGAIQIGDISLLKRVLKCKGADPTRDKNQALRTAAEWGQLEILEFLLKIPGVDPSADHNSPIIMAACGGHINIVQSLLRYDTVRTCTVVETTLYHAIEYGHIKIVQLLLDQRIPGVQITNRMLDVAMCSGDFDIYNMLTKLPGTGHLDNSYVLECASIHNQLDTAKDTIDNDPHIDCVYALYLAANWGSFEVADYLLAHCTRTEKKIDVNKLLSSSISGNNLALINRVLELPGVNAAEISLTPALKICGVDIIKRLAELPEVKMVQFSSAKWLEVQDFLREECYVRAKLIDYDLLHAIRPLHQLGKLDKLAIFNIYMNIHNSVCAKYRDEYELYVRAAIDEGLQE